MFIGSYTSPDPRRGLNLAQTSQAPLITLNTQFQNFEKHKGKLFGLFITSLGVAHTYEGSKNGFNDKKMF